MAQSRRLWVDLGTAPNKSCGLKFQLRITSTGQPFGYRPDAPNQKIELGKRQEKWKKLLENKKVTKEAFKDATGSDIIDAKCAVSFADICNLLYEKSQDEAINELSKREGALADTDIVKSFVMALEKSLNSKVILQQLDPNIVTEQEEYIRFFGRLGQGGTRLSDDELTYSIIKHQYPQIHDRMKEIMQGPTGRLAGEVDLVLAALRVAKTMAPWDNAKEWEVISRPSPAFVSELKERDDVLQEFYKMIGLDNQDAILKTILSQVKDALSYKDTQPEGLPAMLLACLPRELVDVLILFSIEQGKAKEWQENDRSTLRAFVLHWLLFVGDDGKAGWRAFQHAVDKNKNWVFTEESIRNLIGEYEKEGVAHFIPREEEVLSKLQDEVNRGDHRLRSWAERFTAADRDGESKPGEALRVLSTKRELVKRALMWLQRSYIAEKFPDYDPISDRDEDLPIDLDHIVPYDVFGFDWRSRGSRLKEPEGKDIFDNFRWVRGVVGNSLGNFRWLAASENRSRGKGAYVPIENNADLVENPQEWNDIIPQDTDKLWLTKDIATFQRLIDLRTLELYKKLLTESGIKSILPTPSSRDS